jgi:hypothetical protein
MDIEESLEEILEKILKKLETDYTKITITEEEKDN